MHTKTKRFFSSFFYLLILISLWGLVEMTIELFTKNILIYKISIYLLMLILSVLIYIFGFKDELVFNYPKDENENQIKNKNNLIKN